MLMLNQSFSYKELTFEEYKNISDSLSHEKLIIARDRAGSLLKHTKLFIDKWLSNKSVLKYLGFEIFVMPDTEQDAIAFIGGWVPRIMYITVRVWINGLQYQKRLAKLVFYQDNYDTQIEWDIAEMVRSIVLKDEA